MKEVIQDTSTVKKPMTSQRERVEKKYGKVVTYYAELLGICHEAVKGNSLLNKLDPMGQKTSATTLFIRACARMDKADGVDTAEKLMDISKQTKSKVA